MASHGWSSSRDRISSYSSISRNGPAVTDEDFSYITSEDLDDPFLSVTQTPFNTESRPETTGSQVQDLRFPDFCPPLVLKIDDSGTNENNPLTAHRRLRAVKHYSISSIISGVPSEAVCDTGSDINVMSEAFARRHKFKLDRSHASKSRLSNALTARTVGTTRTKYRFKDEEEYHDVFFYVFATCPDDVILGNSFLRLSGTLRNDNKHRIKESYRPCLLSGNRLFFISATYAGCHMGSAKRLLPCHVNGYSCDAIQDSGSDLVVISGSYARSCNFQIDATPRSRVRLVDGSIIWTDGMVWDTEVEFASTKALDLDSYLHNIESLESWLSLDKNGVISRDLTHSTAICDLHVAEGPLCNMMLSMQFLRDTGVLCQQPVDEQLPQKGLSTKDVSAIRRLEDLLQDRVKKRIDDWKSKNPNDNPSQANLQQMVPKEIEQEMVKRDVEDRIIRMMPVEQKQAAVDAALNRRWEWQDSQRLADRLARSSSKSTTVQGSSDLTAT